MTQNNNFLSVLPWYTSIKEQDFRKSYAFGEIYPLFVPSDFLIPFQLMREHRDAAVQSVMMYDKNGCEIADITEAIKAAGLQIFSFTDFGYDVILYPARISMPLNMRDGLYYLTLSDGVQTWYSELFTVVQNTSQFLKIEWWDIENLHCDAGTVVYQTTPTFKNRVFLRTELGRPDYKFEEDGETRDGYFFPEKQISEKTYKCTFLATEYLCDVLRLVRMADFVRITDKYGRVYDCDTFLITPKWQSQSNFASVEMEFETATVVKKIGRAYTVQDKGGDYNSDYNNDYKIE